MPILSAPTITIINGIEQGFHVEWTVIAGASKYRIYYKAAPTSSYLPYVEINSGTATNITSLTNSVTYWVAISAVDSEGIESTKSPDITVITGMPIITEQPVNLVAYMKSGSVKLTWQAPTFAVDGYKIFYTTNTSNPRVWAPFSGASIDGNPFSSGDFYSGNVSEITLTGLTNHTIYYFVISAIKNDIESAVSETVTAFPFTSTVVTDFIAGNIVKLNLTTGYNLIAFPLSPKNFTPTYLGLKQYLASVSQIFYFKNGKGKAVGITTDKAIAAGECALVVMSSAPTTKCFIGDPWIA